MVFADSYTPEFTLEHKLVRGARYTLCVANSLAFSRFNVSPLYQFVYFPLPTLPDLYTIGSFYGQSKSQMHLFITAPAVEGRKLVITEERLVHQIRNVLRMKVGDEFLVQHADEQTSSRWMVEIQSVSDQLVLTDIIGLQQKIRSTSKLGLLIALPNKSDKLDIMIQKTTEVGVDKVIFWPAMRSQMRTLEPARIERLQKIALEASEQAKRWFVPEVAFVPSLQGWSWLQEHRLIIFNDDGDLVEEGLVEDIQLGKLYGVIGPEGGLHADDLAVLEPSVVKTLSLGQYTLKMETAAIVAGWILNNIEQRVGPESKIEEKTSWEEQEQ